MADVPRNSCRHSIILPALDFGRSDELVFTGDLSSALLLGSPLEAFQKLERVCFAFANKPGKHGPMPSRGRKHP
jgi:hypothetical protein